MKTFEIWTLAVCAAACLGCSGTGKDKSSAPKFRTAPITRMDVVSTVEATGTITPRNTTEGIPVGAQVNGRIIKLFVDYNSIVTNGQVVALIDPLVYEATYKSQLAQLHVNEANVMVREAAVASCEAEVKLAEKTYARKETLVKKALAPVAELDDAEESLAKARANLKSAEASLLSARASVEQSQANVAKSKADLDYCTIVSPVNGVVIARKVDEGETVVSSMNAVPVLTIAEDLKTVWVEATVPEADVGNLKVGQEVSFTADAYRRKFTGRVKQIRKAATTTNNVVTFPVIIEAENPDEMLFPGMTATLSIVTDRAENVPAVAAAAFRFRPKSEDFARLGDVPRGRKLWLQKSDGSIEWVLVKEGVSDDAFTQIICEDSTRDLVGAQAIVGYETGHVQVNKSDTENPFMPKMPKPGSNKGTAPEPKSGSPRPTK